MNIEIRQPALEAIIQQCMDSGHYESVEDLLMHTLAPVQVHHEGTQRSGLALLEVMQQMPYSEDVEIAFSCAPMPVRDISL